MSTHKTTIGIIGGGNMGTAIFERIRSKYAVLLCEQDPRRARLLKKRYKIRLKTMPALIAKSSVVMIAVKPQNFDEVLRDMKPHVKSNQVVVSIAAGITTRYIEQRLGRGVRVVRAMPNLPAQVGEGATGVCPGKWARRADLIFACRIFSCIGQAVVVKEKWMDVVTAVSGSGPAYVFFFAECLQKAGRRLGLSEALSRQLVQQTLKGSVRLWEATGEEVGALRARVTSKGGTTQAAMEVLNRRQTAKIFGEALKAARKRAKVLSK